MPRSALPLDDRWSSEDEYVQSLLTLVTSCDIFRNLCGGVHILDFLTREPDLYTTVLPGEWRKWFDSVDVYDLLDLLLRHDLDKLDHDGGPESLGNLHNRDPPPASLVRYVATIRKHCLLREKCKPSEVSQHMPRHMKVGMKPKKIHEVANFAAYVGDLSARVSQSIGEPISLVDFGSGQNYLGRTLASPPYEKHVVAIERKHHNVTGARGMDVHAKLAKKEKILRNKKEYKKQLAETNGTVTTPPSPPETVYLPQDEDEVEGKGSITYIEHEIQDGQLEDILYPSSSESGETASRTKSLIISLHSCGNLSHHAIRSLPLNPSVTAVAIIGCCYNLLTERLGPVTYKHPQLRPNHPRLVSTSSAYDPHGFPMSRTLETFTNHTNNTRGVRLNITARMMGVQAPYNWGHEDSEAFFRRHFYRALLQRILLERGVVKQSDEEDSVAGGTLDGNSQTQGLNGEPLIIGSLRKACFVSFREYVKGALQKLYADSTYGEFVRGKTQDLTDDVVDEYEAKWGYAKKNLAIIWSLMAFSAGVVESVIAVDRWLFLKEQECVEECWVEPVFDYKWSPRNLCVVGIKKKNMEKGREG